MITILIPSYKRLKVLTATLQSIEDTLVWPKHDIRGHIAVMGVDDHDFRNYQLPTVGEWTIDKMPNIGKANAINVLFAKYHNIDSPNWLLLIDNDMYFRQSWAHILRCATELDLSFDLMGFASTIYKIHIPVDLKHCPYSMVYNHNHAYRLYSPISIGGGMMLLRPETFLACGGIESYGQGVYLGEDDLLSRKLSQKYVLSYNTPWVEHDPFGMEYYPEYELRKREIITNHPPETEIVFNRGWDTESIQYIKENVNGSSCMEIE